jgi:ParB-like chromosome segregation protein Spo0J
MTETVWKNICDLKPHPINVAIYGEEKKDTSDNRRLTENIAADGFDDKYPIIIKADGTIISGHRRCACSLWAGLTKLPCTVVEFANEHEEHLELIKANAYRMKDTIVVTREMQYRLVAYKEIAAIRQKESQFSSKAPAKTTKKTAGPTLAAPASRDARKALTQAAESAGMKRETARKAIKVVETIDKLNAEGKTEQAAELTATLNQSIDRAHKIIKPPKELPVRKGMPTMPGIGNGIDEDMAKKFRVNFTKIHKARSDLARWVSVHVGMLKKLGGPSAQTSLRFMSEEEEFGSYVYSWTQELMEATK